MKKQALFITAILALSLGSVLAQTQTTPTTSTPTASTTPTTNEQKATETCTQQGLTGAALDECVKQEVMKLTSAKPAAPAQPTQTGN